MSETALERALVANFEQTSMNALMTGYTSRQMKMEEIRPALTVHPATTTALCSGCGQKVANQLIRRGDTGAYHAACGDCAGQVSRSL